ncbi:hypothetical protein [Neptuniibacter sp.]|uniref:hypothetical protein n=1 Tax=Neptuniibacter sp. TaxID=1962643 RepID=UPI002607C971|nr:hypothetical protein [Neptuniibacter sp.]MCP4596178.1 hypothetical protein [Neptuniibacter sp.]
MADATTETPEERKRRKARERQQAKREREREHRKAVGAKDYKFTMYRGTEEALERLTEFNECEEWQEVTTLLIHNADKLRESDPALLKKLLQV